MTLGEKLAKLRKENHYTQEQLADILDVSRQSVSKWESDVAYPETEKLVKLGKLYHCSMDYLLNDEIEEETKKEEQAKKEETPSFVYAGLWRQFFFERKSKRAIGGVPLWHINIGFGRVASGIFSIGLVSKGVFSLGIFSLGIFSIGVFALGLLAFGAMACGMFSAGAISVGVIAAGAIAVGIVAFGALAIGQYSVGALAIGNYFALGDHAYGKIAIYKTEGNGSIYMTNAYLQADYQAVMRVLDAKTPWIFGWAKAIIGNVLQSVAFW